MGILSETIFDLANELLNCKDWDPCILNSSVQKEIPAQKYFENSIPFAIGRESIMDIPIDHQGYADVHINNTKGLTDDLLGTRNAD
jgi:hypothetical protein